MTTGVKQAIKILIVAIVLFWPPAFLYLNYYSNITQNESADARLEKMVFIEKHAQALIGNKLFVDVCSFLNNAYKKNEISLYYLEGGAAQCGKPGDINADSFPVKAEGKIHNVEADTGTLFYQRLKNADSDLILGLLHQRKLSLADVLMKNSRGVLTGILIDTLIAMWIVLALWTTFVLRNIEMMRTIYRQSHSPPFWFNIFNKLADFLEPQQGLSSAQIHRTAAKEIQKLREERQYHADTLEYSILSELEKSNHGSFPFSFEGTVARIDINGYSAYVYEGNRSFLVQMKRSFEWLAAECAYRYGGLFEGRQGDEVVYVFTGNEKELRATAFIRDFSSQFSQLRFDFLHQKGVQLFVKSSIATSELTMEASPSKFDFDGDALYLTNRMFGTIDSEEKQQNLLIIFPKDYEKIQSLAAKPYTEKQNVKKEATLHVAYISDFKYFSIPQDGKFFLGDLALKQQLAFVSDQTVSSTDKHNVLDTLLKNLRVRRISQQVSDSWLECLLKVIAQDGLNSLLSPLISIGRLLVPPANWAPHFSESIVGLGGRFDSRSTANAIELLASWGDFGKLSELYSQFDNPGDSYRAEGNFLLQTALRSPTEKSFTDINAMISSSDKRIADTGLYVGSTLVLSLRERSATELATFSGYHLLIRNLRKAKPTSDRLQALKYKALEEMST